MDWDPPSVQPIADARGEVWLVRHARLPRDIRRRSDGPVGGGRFWAVEEADGDGLPFGCDHGWPYDGLAGLERMRCRRPAAPVWGCHRVRTRLSRILEAGCRVWARNHPILEPGATG